MSFLMRVFVGASELSPMAFVLRAVITYIALVVMVRVMGQREITQLTAIDFIVAIVIGSVVAPSLGDPKTPLWAALLSVTVVVVTKIINSYLTLKSQWFARLTSGEPIVLVKDGSIHEGAMRKGRMTVDSMMSEMRRNKVFSLADVEFAVLEPTGKINVMKKREQQPVTKKDLAIGLGSSWYPAVLVKEGRIFYDNLAEVGLSEAWLRGQLASMGINELDDIFVAQLSTTGSLFVDCYSDTLPLEKGVVEDLILSQLRKLEGQFSSFALETDNTNAQQMFDSLSTRAHDTYQRLSGAWADKTQLQSHKL